MRKDVFRQLYKIKRSRSMHGRKMLNSAGQCRPRQDNAEQRSTGGTVQDNFEHAGQCKTLEDNTWTAQDCAGQYLDSLRLCSVQYSEGQSMT
jgi:hypothetical protein